MRHKIKIMLLVMSVLALAGLAGCNGEDSGRKTLKIGYVNPSTGALAGNGEGCDWVVKQMTDFVQAHPVKAPVSDHRLSA